MTVARSDAGALTGDTTVEVGPLAYRHEHGGWTVGSLQTGEAVDLPDIAVTVLRALEEGNTVGRAAEIAEQAHGERPDVLGFVDDLAELGFVRRHGDRPPESPSRPGGLSFRWLKPRAVSWVFRPAPVTIIATFILVALGLAIARGDVGFGYRDYFAFRYPGVSLAWSIAVFTVGALLHESWHLAAARAAGIPARISLSTRLIFLTAQTAAPLMWLATRRERLSFYLAGMTCDLVLASVSALIAMCCRSGTFPAEMAHSATLILLLGIISEFAFCLRTDVYLLIQELLRCRNLFEDARDYARFWIRRVVARSRRHHLPRDPTLELPVHERRPVRVYSAIMVAGSFSLLAFTAAYGLPITVTLYVRAAQGVLSAQPWRLIDGLGTLTVEGATQALLIGMLIRRWRQRFGPNTRWPCRHVSSG